VRRTWDNNQGVNEKNLQTLPQEIPTVTQTKRISNRNSNTHNIRNIKKIKSEALNITKGQKNLKISSINPRSVKNKTIAICDFILSNDFDLVAFTETWLGSTVDKTWSSELVPNGYRIQQVPRPGKTRGGGVAISYKANIDFKMLTSSSDGHFSTFEYSDCNIAINKNSLCLSVIYKPPPSQQNGFSTNEFLEHEWPLFRSKYATTDKPIVIVGDLSFHLDIPTDRDTSKFNSCLETFGMEQHVRGPTHVAGHTLNVIITRDTDTIVSNIEVNDPGLADSDGKISRDHFAVIFHIRAEKPAPIRKTVTYRKLRSIDIESFRNDIESLEIINSNVIISDVDEHVESFNNSLASLVDKHAPLLTKQITLRPTSPWYNEDYTKPNI
jgi:hypothetical protein